MTTTATATRKPAANKATTPAKATKPAPAKKAPAKSAAKKAPAATAASAKLRWLVEGDRNQKGGKEQAATAGDRTYAIARSGDAWVATVTQGRKSTVLSEGSFAKAYNAAVQHNKTAQA